MGNVKKFYSYFSLTIENIEFIYLTKYIIKLKVNLFCRVNLVFNTAIFLKNKGLRTFLGGTAICFMR
mgnify:CR=1 FL=1